MCHPRLKIASALAIAALVGACRAEAPRAEAGATDVAASAAVSPQEVVVRTRDFAFQSPDTISSGLTTFRLINDGPDFHHIQLVRLDDGHTLQDALDHMAAGGPPPAWVVDVGGPNTPGMPGEETQATLDLKPGNYAMLCVIPARDGQPHIMKGMMKPLTVVPAVGAQASAPVADINMVLDDYSFQSTPAITAGRRTIRVENRAKQSHEVLIARLEPGKTPQDLLRFIEKPEGMPPGKIVGGTTGMATGEVNHVVIDFEPGEYALLCFVPDAGDGKPHFVHGMVQQIRVS